MSQEIVPEDRRAAKGRGRRPETREARESAERQAGILLQEVETVAATRRSLGDMEKAVKRTETFAKIMDKYLLDPVLGLLPVAGDTATSAAGLYIVAEALNAGVPKRIIFKMLVNLALDVAIGAIPVAGDIADIFFKANKRNAKLFREYFEKAKKETSESSGT